MKLDDLFTGHNILYLSHTTYYENQIPVLRFEYEKQTLTELTKIQNQIKNN